VRKFLREYWVEIVGLFVVLIALFFLLNRSRIGVMRQAGEGFLSSLGRWFNNLHNSVFGQLGRMTSMELLAWMLIVGGLIVILYRMRVRYLKSDHWQATVCPKCGSKLNRIHRTRLDRMLGPIFLPHAVRYRCSNSNCRWSGLRHGRAPQAGLQSRDTTSTRS
jgi:hypothetical protein